MIRVRQQASYLPCLQHRLRTTITAAVVEEHCPPRHQEASCRGRSQDRRSLSLATYLVAIAVAARLPTEQRLVTAIAATAKVAGAVCRCPCATVVKIDVGWHLKSSHCSCLRIAGLLGKERCWASRLLSGQSFRSLEGNWFECFSFYRSGRHLGLFHDLQNLMRE